MSISSVASAIAVSRLSALAVSLLRGATAAMAIGDVRCATFSVCRSISPACRPTGSRAFTADAAPPCALCPRAVIGDRQTPARPRDRRHRGGALRKADDRAVAAPSRRGSALAPADRYYARQGSLPCPILAPPVGGGRSRRRR